MDYEQLYQFTHIKKKEKVETFKYLDKKYIDFCEYINDNENEFCDELNIVLPNLKDSIYEKNILKYKNECFEYMNNKYKIPKENMKYCFEKNKKYPDGVYIFSIYINNETYIKQSLEKCISEPLWRNVLTYIETVYLYKKKENELKNTKIINLRFHYDEINEIYEIHKKIYKKKDVVSKHLSKKFDIPLETIIIETFAISGSYECVDGFDIIINL